MFIVCIKEARVLHMEHAAPTLIIINDYLMIGKNKHESRILDKSTKRKKKKKMLTLPGLYKDLKLITLRRDVLVSKTDQ